MHSVIRKLPLVLTLLVAACGIGRSPEDARKTDAALAEAALNAGTPEVALRLSDASLAKNPSDADALTRRGQALTELGQLGEARASLHKAVTIEPRNVRALLALGRVQLPIDPAGAEVDFESALKQDSQNAAALNDLGIARDLQGHHADAESAYRGAMASQPNMVAAQVNLALCLAIGGRGGEAIRLVQPLADAPEATRKIKEDYAAVLAMAGEREEARRILSTNLAANEVASALDVLTSARAAAAFEAPPTPQVADRSDVPVPAQVAARSNMPVPAQVAGHGDMPVPAQGADRSNMPAPEQGADRSNMPVPAQIADRSEMPAASEHQPVVQLAALNSEEAAHDKWAELSTRFPALFGGRQPVYTQAERDGHTFWRVRTTGFQDVAQAQSFCARVRTAGGACAVFNS
jgi:Flp pilus assembly protein TadD